MMTATPADVGADEIELVRLEPVDDDTPGEGTCDEDAAAIGRKDPTEVWVGLRGGDEPVHAEGENAGGCPQQTPMLANALPYTSQAPPISATAARTKSRMARVTVMPSILADARGRVGRPNGRRA